jgi:hypothetical protein
MLWSGALLVLAHTVSTSTMEVLRSFRSTFVLGADRSCRVHRNRRRSADRGSFRPSRGPSHHAYDPAVSRYVESDPIGLRGGINSYGYADWNPLTYADPTGEAAGAIPLQGSISIRFPRPVPLPAWLGPAEAVVGAGIAGYAIGTAIYPYIAVPLGDAIEWVCSDNENDKLRKRCQALKDSILKTC